MRGDQRGATARTRLRYFNPLPSHEGRRGGGTRRGKRGEHFNPLPSHEGRLKGYAWDKDGDIISIHSPRMRGDRARIRAQAGAGQISIHSPRMRGDINAQGKGGHEAHISIHSPRMRGDTCATLHRCPRAYFNPLPSHEGRPTILVDMKSALHFNPLPSHEGRQDLVAFGDVRGTFQSTPLA